MKDPLLQSYTFEELLYEYHSIQEHYKAQTEQAEEETDKIEEEKEQKNLDWVEKMEAEEAAAAEAADRAAAAAKESDPSKDPNNIKWMEEQIKKDREIHGEDFGEDLSLDFNSEK